VVARVRRVRRAHTLEGGLAVVAEPLSVSSFPLPLSRAAVVATFSIAAADPTRGEVGVAVASKFLAVGSVVPWVTAGVGAVATQAMANVSYGVGGLGLLAQGLDPREVVEELTAADAGRDLRQLGVVGADGRAATFTGPGCLPWAGGRVGPNYACQGNILAGPEVVDAMAAAFEAGSGTLAERLLAALAAGDAAGGDRRGRQSAALYVARAGGGYLGMNDRFIDLRVDDHATPVSELGRLLGLHAVLYGAGDAMPGVELTPELRREVAERLGRALGETVADDDGENSLAAALRTWAGRENLESRLRDDGRIDAILLEVLRGRT
jgi:uncharacterized Ntn-hydrolase superfamily protein